MDYDNFKQKRQFKRDNDTNIKNAVLKLAKRYVSRYNTCLYSKNQLDIGFQSIIQQNLKQKYKDSIQREYRNISNSRYNDKKLDWTRKKFEIIMDYDFSIQ